MRVIGLAIGAAMADRPAPRLRVRGHRAFPFLEAQRGLAQGHEFAYRGEVLGEETVAVRMDGCAFKEQIE